MQSLFEIKINGKVVGHINQFEYQNNQFSCEVALIMIQKTEENYTKKSNAVNVPSIEVPKILITKASKTEMDKQVDEFIKGYYQDKYVIEERTW